MMQEEREVDQQNHWQAKQWNKVLKALEEETKETVAKNEDDKYEDLEEEVLQQLFQIEEEAITAHYPEPLKSSKWDDEDDDLYWSEVEDNEEELTIKFAKLSPKAIIPSYQTPGSAGMDLAIIETITIPPQEMEIVETGL